MHLLYLKRIPLKSRGVPNGGMVAINYASTLLDYYYFFFYTGDAEKEECGGSGVRCFGTVSGVFWN